MNYSELLKASGIKATPHKVAILELFAQHRHLNASQIVFSLHGKNINISLATVYRILASLENNRLITKHNFGNDQAIYELNNANEHHDHLICLSCGQVTEFINQEIEELQEQIARTNQFQLHSHSLNIYGKCKNCHKTESCSQIIEREQSTTC